MDCKLSAALGTAVLARAAVVKHTVVMGCPDSRPRRLSGVSLFSPKTATIEDIAIALVKMFELAAWRSAQDI